MRDEKTASLVNGTIVYDWTDIPDGEKRSKMNEHLQHMADESERQPHTDVSPILIIQMPEVHQTNDIIEPKDLQQHYTASKQRNKRLDNLVKMFEQHPDDAQNRILEIISTFGRLTSAGQKQAVKRIKELAELTKYQAKQENDG